MSPPCAWAIQRTMARPSPLPARSLVSPRVASVGYRVGGMGARDIRAIEALEDVWQMIGGDARPIVADGEARPLSVVLLVCCERDAHTGAIWAAVLQRVLNQIAEHPRQIEAITENGHVGQRIHLYPETPLLGQRRETLGDIEDKLVEMHDLAQFPGMPAVGPRQEKQIVHQMGHVLALLLDHREGGALAGR